MQLAAFKSHHERFPAVTAYLIGGIMLAVIGWAAMSPNPGMGYQQLLDQSGSPVVDDKGIPKIAIVQFSPITKFIYNLVPNLLMIAGAVCILAASLKVIRTLRRQGGTRDRASKARSAIAIQPITKESEQDVSADRQQLHNINPNALP